MNTLHPASRVSEQRFYHLSENSAIRERSGESLSQCSPFERFFLQNGGWVLSRRRWLWMRNWKWKRKTIRLMPSFLWLLFSSMVTSSASDILETPGNFPGLGSISSCLVSFFFAMATWLSSVLVLLQAATPIHIPCIYKPWREYRTLVLVLCPTQSHCH